MEKNIFIIHIFDFIKLARHLRYNYVINSVTNYVTILIFLLSRASQFESPISFVSRMQIGQQLVSLLESHYDSCTCFR